MSDFKATDGTKAIAPTLGSAWGDIAFAQANEFVAVGQTPRQAASIVASLMIENAWVVAGCGVIAEGGKPDKDKFRAVVEAVLERITFDASSVEGPNVGSTT